MPRYLLETEPVAGLRPDAAERPAAQRFPEIAVEGRFSTQDHTGARSIWLCRAPSEAHIGRWAAAVDLSIESVRRIETHHPPQDARQPSSAPDPDEEEP